MLVRVAPVGLTGYGLAAGEVAEQTHRGLSCSLPAHFAFKRLSILTSYSGKVANGRAAIDSNQAGLDLKIGPAGHLGDQCNNGT